MAKRMHVRGHKYNAKRTEVDGIAFASMREANRFQELKLLERAGEIRDLELQPKFPLQMLALDRNPSKDGEIVLRGVGEYRADFTYEERAGRSWRRVIEDVKGFKTPVYRLKKKMVEASYGIEIREV